MPMRICLLTTQDLDAEPFPENDWPRDPRPFLPAAEWTVLVLDKETAVRQILAAGGEAHDLFFNLCDGAWDEATPGIEVVRTLERLGVPFTGGTSSFYDPSRESMKRVCSYLGLATPDYAFARDEDDVWRAADALTLPLIVKHPNSYGSIGLKRESRVESREALLDQARRMFAEHAGALVEEFVEGGEYTVLVAENPRDPASPTTFQPIGFRFPNGETFKHWNLKWEDYAKLESFAVEDLELDCQLREAAGAFFHGMGGTGYGRCDFRVDADGCVFMLEINPNCGLYYPPGNAGSADLCLLHDPAGHEGFTRQIVEAALRRHAREARSWEVRHTQGVYGLFAVRPIARGERILEFEGRGHEIVSRSFVEANWDEQERSWFESYAWPLTDELWVTWSRDPEDWRPVNHSCDPSVWLEGLDVVARRPIAAGEEITLDYATFCNELHPTFECECGSDSCRGVVRGDDYLRDFVARYGDHVSDYVRRKRAELSAMGRVEKAS